MGKGKKKHQKRQTFEEQLWNDIEKKNIKWDIDVLIDEKIK